MIPLRWKRLSMVFPASHSLVPTESPYERIADEVLLKIFSFLTHPQLCQITSVNKRFKTLALDISFWKKEKRQCNDKLYRGICKS